MSAPTTTTADVAPHSGPPTDTYESLYESHAQATDDHGVGDGDYDLVGEIEFDVLRAEGLTSESRLLDFGCGNGRLGVHVAPYLNNGAYIGTDVSRTFLDHASRRIGMLPNVALFHQVGVEFDMVGDPVDFICAFSVFTHMEHEDMYRYLVAMRSKMTPDGKFVISCLPMDLVDAQRIFLDEAALDPDIRWTRVRNVTTSTDLVGAIATLAGWSVLHWLPGTSGQAPSRLGEMRSLGQSIVVLTPLAN